MDKKIYVRLISKINGEDKYNDYVYRVVLPSVMKTPSSDAYLSSDEVTFKWDNFGSSTLKLLVGKSESDGSYYDSTVSGTSQIVSNLPKDGSKVYVRLSSYINNTWVNRDSSYTAMTTTASNNGTCEFTVNHYRQYLAPLTMGAITYPLLVGSKLNFSGDRHFAKVENTGEHDIEIKYNRRKRTLAPGENKTMYTPLWRLSSVECLTTTSEKRGLFESFRDEVLASGGDIIEDTGDLIYTVGDTVATALVETLGLTGDNLPAEMIALIQFLDEGLAIDATVTATIMYTLVVDGIDEAMKTLHDTLLEDRGSIINGRNLTCDDNLGNTDEAFSSKDKFKNMILNDEYSDINNYLMIQASAKTYPHNFHHNRTATRRPKTTNDFQCAAKELYEHWGFDEISYVNTLESVNAIVASNEDMVLIAIRGTESPYFGYIGNENSELDPSRLTGLNGIMDVLVTTSKVPYQIGLFPYTDSSTPEAKVHLGYARSSYIFAYYLRKVFNEIDGFEGKKVYITGHSLGGATAIMTSYFLQNHSTEPIYNIEATYAFASPEIGDAEFTRALYNDGSPYYMTINYRDPIPYVNNKPYERVDFIDQYASSLFGSKYTNIFDAEHKAVAFKGTYSSSSRNEFISTMFGEKRPYVYSSEFGMDEWHFHHTNFYLAYAYKKLLLDGEFLQNGSNITKETFVNKINTGINPEFTRSVTMCMKIDGQVSKPEISWSGDDTYEKLLQDEQSYPFEECDD
ncbi:MAG TPA: lipase family protein [Sulfurimonas sp.]|nr:lipase family protein [Sulfurimonas sp.]